MSSSNSTTTTNSPTQPFVQLVLPATSDGLLDINIEEALGRKPLPWSYQGQVEANRRRQAAKAPQEQKSSKEELEEAKREILELKKGL
ncbi:hypothetical protein J3458_007059 [Metarhizium acridum]|uniref:uncharacterized protein n=1 Tax=Metarhizium acridum TaxID=92637 RepID=UPI001C6C9C26|nr:hypothetical protein J3458_007059 [Metarhizium acridum]